EESATSFRRIEGFLHRAKEHGEVHVVISDEFKSAMDDDLAVPTALALISGWLRSGNSAITDGNFTAVVEEASKIRGALNVLGCDPFDSAFNGDQSSDSSSQKEVLDGLIAGLLQEREEARARKDFTAADRIRDRISTLGITIEDTASGPRWGIS
ncbi:MAG: cysteine--tRNA ligase, partial [Actinomycetota bacterium]